MASKQSSNCDTLIFRIENGGWKLRLLSNSKSLKASNPTKIRLGCYLSEPHAFKKNQNSSYIITGKRPQIACRKLRYQFWRSLLRKAHLLKIGCYGKNMCVTPLVFIGMNTCGKGTFIIFPPGNFLLTTMKLIRYKDNMDVYEYLV